MSDTTITAVYGRSHDPFTGEKKQEIYPSDHAFFAKVKTELEKHNTPVEVIATATEVVVKSLSRTAQAAARIALDMYTEGKITAEQVVASIPTDKFTELLNNVSADVTGLTIIGTGTAAADGVVSGKIAKSAAKAVEMSHDSAKVILVVDSTTPEDMDALKAVVGIVTLSGGITSHSAIVARQMGKPCIVSAKFSAELDEGGDITIDGNAGTVWAGIAKFEIKEISNETEKLLGLIDSVAKMKVYANADTPADVELAVKNGTAGIGLCRTEHIFFDQKGIDLMRRLILAVDGAKNSSLSAVKNYHDVHFSNYFDKVPDNMRVIVRLLDPPMHEFLPKLDDKETIKQVAKAMKMSIASVVDRITQLQETNPMLGHRGARLGITFNNLYAIQAKSIAEMAFGKAYNNGKKFDIGIMLPLIVDITEFNNLYKIVSNVIKEVRDNYSTSTSNRVKIDVGSMLETPRACMISYGLAENCTFFSFGTNDLTQAAWALSRDDSATFMPKYLSEKLVLVDPFKTLDPIGVGGLMDHAIGSLAERREKVSVGICGEHGGDGDSIIYCSKLGLDYVSCSPHRLVAARIFAARAAVDPSASQVENVFETIVLEQPATIKVEHPKHKVKPVEVSEATDDNVKLNNGLGQWLIETPDVKFNWVFDTDNFKNTIVPDVVYVARIHPDEHDFKPMSSTANTKHIITLVKFSNDKSSYKFVTPNGKVGESTSIDSICSIAQADEQTAKLFPDQGGENQKKDKVELEVDLDLSVHGELLDQLAKLQASGKNFEDLSDAAKLWNGKFVYIKTFSNWFKVVGYLNTEQYKTSYLIVELPKTLVTGKNFHGVLKHKIVWLTNVDEDTKDTKTRAIKVHDISDIASELSSWE